jgi:SH3 domain
MVEYVYARHDFVPEHDDEVPFRAGDRIEVLEKDEQYADGWWLVRSPSCSLTLKIPLPELAFSLVIPLSALLNSRHSYILTPLISSLEMKLPSSDPPSFFFSSTF